MSKRDDEEEQRWWNLTAYKVYATDEEMDASLPWLVVFVIALLVLAWVFG